MTSRRRRQTRGRRFGYAVWSPPDHNRHIRLLKESMRAAAFMRSIGLPLMPWQRALLDGYLRKSRAFLR